jgi:hypothetical protein
MDIKEQKNNCKYIHYFQIFNISLELSESNKHQIFRKLVDSMLFSSIIVSSEINCTNNNYTHHILMKIDEIKVNLYFLF